MMANTNSSNRDVVQGSDSNRLNLFRNESIKNIVVLRDGLLYEVRGQQLQLCDG
jgi:hypothetical protein